MIALALQGVEYFVNAIHGFLFLTKPTKPTKLFLVLWKPANRRLPGGARLCSRHMSYLCFDSFVGFVAIKSIKVLRRVVLDVRGLVVARLPHIGAVAVRDSIHNPLGQVFSGRIEIQYLVDVGMVDFPVNQAFDFSKVAHHAIAVKLFSTAIHIDFPVVAV
jgi:hypothetical protein